MATDALMAFHDAEGLPAGGTDGSRWDVARAFGLPVPVLNSRARLRILPYHDLHHVITGYRTDEAGEAEVGEWTLATETRGGSVPPLGAVYDLGTFLIGLVRAPRRTVRAFFRGRHHRNLYDREVGWCLDASVDQLRRHCHMDGEERATRGADVVALVGVVALAVAVWATPVGPLVLGLTALHDLVSPLGWP